MLESIGVNEAPLSIMHPPKKQDMVLPSLPSSEEVRQPESRPNSVNSDQSSPSFDPNRKPIIFSRSRKDTSPFKTDLSSIKPVEGKPDYNVNFHNASNFKNTTVKGLKPDLNKTMPINNDDDDSDELSGFEAELKKMLEKKDLNKSEFVPPRAKKLSGG